MSFKEKRVWITGASSGIGEALAFAFAGQGAHLILSGRNEIQLRRVADQCQGAASVTILPLDLENIASLQQGAKRVLQQYGKVDILLLNAGISQRSAAKDTNLEVVQKIMNVNYIGNVALTQAVLPSMITHQLGHIVVVSSAVGKFGSPLRSAYAASKHALHGYYDSLRAEIHDDNVRVTIVCPGFVRTNISLNALTANGNPQGSMDEATQQGLKPATVANIILAAIKNQREEVYIGNARIIFGIYMKRFFPRIFSRQIRKAKVT